MKTSTYHSTNPDDPNVHHDHDDCPPGSQIPAKYRKQGTGGYRRCDKCRQMD